MAQELLGDPCEVLINWEDASSNLARPELDAIRATLERQPLPDDWAIVFAEGRNVCISNEHEYYFPPRADSARWGIYLSGGFYRPIKLLTTGVASSQSSSIGYPTSDNFADVHPEIVTTQYVNEIGLVVSRARQYIPCGGYTEGHALQKATNTKEMERRTEWGPLGSDFRPFVVPKVVGTYKFPDFVDSYGNPISGIAMLGPSPDTLFSVQLNNWINNNLDRIGPMEFLDEVSYRIKQITFYLSADARYLHDKFSLTHGQLTLGNCGRLFRNHLNPKSGRMTFIKD